MIALVNDAGLTGWHAGPLCNSAAAEALTSVLIAINKNHTIKHSGIKLLESNISIQIFSTEKFPMIEPGDDLASIIYNNIIDNNIKIDDGDVIAVAQKVISKAENRYRSLMKLFHLKMLKSSLTR